MAADSGDTSWAQGPFGDDVWDVELDEAFVNAARVKEDSAQARLLAAEAGEPPPAQLGWRDAAAASRNDWQSRHRRALRVLAVCLVAVLGIAVGAHALSYDVRARSDGVVVAPSPEILIDTPDPNLPARPAGETVQGGSATVTYPPGTVSAESGVPAVAPSLPAGDNERPVITMPIAFPRAVKDPVSGRGYTRVGYRAANGCTDVALVSAALAEQIEQRSGCRGLFFALYADGSGNLYTIAVLTLNSIGDSFGLLQWYTRNLSVNQIGALIPGPESGLQILQRTSGATQTFAASGRILTIGLAQWSDGEPGDYQQLQGLLSPLFRDISARAADYEGGMAMVPEAE